VLTGQRIERRDIGAPGEFESLTDEELERALVERFNALALPAAVVRRGAPALAHENSYLSR
jgi:hypothetical protein